MSTLANNPNEREKKEYPLRQIYFYLTEGCNLACRHCWLSPKNQNDNNVYPVLSIQKFENILDQAIPLGMTDVKLTGGEPLMHPRILDIMKILKDRGLSFTIETNGVLCTKEIAKHIADSGNPSVSISLDSADSETHEWIRGISGCFNAAIDGVRNLVNVGIRPQIIMTLMKHNITQIRQIVRLAESLNAGSIKFNLLQPTGRAENLIKIGDSLTVEEVLAEGKAVMDSLQHESSIKIYYDLPIAFRPLSYMFGDNGDGCSTCAILSIIGVLANGDYALCGIGAHIPELIFGNSDRDSLNHIWKKNKILNELRQGIPDRFEGICSQCLMKRACAASCIAQNYYRSHSLWGPYWFCNEAFKKGIFPKSRIAPQIT